MDYIDRARLEIVFLLLLLLLCLADAVRDNMGLAFISIRKRPSNVPYIADLKDDIRAIFASILSSLSITFSSSSSVNDLELCTFVRIPSKFPDKFSNSLSALLNDFSKFGPVSLAGSMSIDVDIGIYIKIYNKTLLHRVIQVNSTRSNIRFLIIAYDRRLV